MRRAPRCTSALFLDVGAFHSSGLIVYPLVFTLFTRFLSSYFAIRYVLPLVFYSFPLLSHPHRPSTSFHFCGFHLDFSLCAGGSYHPTTVPLAFTPHALARALSRPHVFVLSCVTDFAISFSPHCLQASSSALSWLIASFFLSPETEANTRRIPALCALWELARRQALGYFYLTPLFLFLQLHVCAPAFTGIFFT